MVRLCSIGFVLVALSACGDVETLANEYSVGAYYYPWHAEEFHGRRYLREHLDPPQVPLLGEYNDRDPEVIRQHLDWSRDAGISFWIASWWGPGSTTDVTLREHIFPHPELGNMRIAIHYETTGRTRDFTDYSQVESDFAYLAKTYFGHTNYLTLKERPVVFVYLTRVLARKGTLEASIQAMRDGAAQSGHELYIVGDHSFGAPPAETGDLELLDAISDYDVYGSMASKGHAGQDSVDRYFQRQSEWRTKAHSSQIAYIPAVTPGFNDKGVRTGHEVLSRKLSPDDEFGSLFRAMIRGAKPLADAATGKMLVITSWNEWHEDTIIEPVRSVAPTREDDSASRAFTSGFEYEGYGTRYLDILREEIARADR